MRSLCCLLAVTSAVLLALPACSTDDEQRSTPTLRFAASNSHGDFAAPLKERTTAHVEICVDGLAKPTHRVQVENPAFESVMFTVDATDDEVIVQPRGGVLGSGELLEVSMELAPFVSRTGRRLVSLVRSNGDEMLSVSLVAVVDARLLEVTPVGWADAQTFVVAIKNPTGFTATDVWFEHEDATTSDAVDEIGPGETRRVVVARGDGQPPALGSRVALRSACSNAALPDHHFFVRAPEE